MNIYNFKTTIKKYRCNLFPKKKYLCFFYLGFDKLMLGTQKCHELEEENSVYAKNTFWILQWT